MTWTPRLNPSAKRKYLGIVEALAADIRSGILRSGDRLPPQREIAANLSIDLTTVTRAFNEARKRGLIDATVGKGTFVKPDQPANPPELYDGPTPATDLSMNAPPQPVEADLGRRILSAIADTLALTLDPYPRSAGAEAALKEAGVLTESEASPFAVLAKLKKADEA